MILIVQFNEEIEMDFLVSYFQGLWVVLPILVGVSMILFPRFLDSTQWIRVIGAAILLMQTFAMNTSFEVDRKTLRTEIDANKYTREYVEQQLTFERAKQGLK